MPTCVTYGLPGNSVGANTILSLINNLLYHLTHSFLAQIMVDINTLNVYILRNACRNTQKLSKLHCFGFTDNTMSFLFINDFTAILYRNIILFIISMLYTNVGAFSNNWRQTLFAIDCFCLKII